MTPRQQLDLAKRAGSGRYINIAIPPTRLFSQEPRNPGMVHKCQCNRLQNPCSTSWTSFGSYRRSQTEVAKRCHHLEHSGPTRLWFRLPTQKRLALQACCRLLSKGASKVSTSQSYETYRGLCQEQKTRALTQRRFCDMVGFLDLYGLINARIVSLGRYGKTREIMSSLPERVVKGLV